MHRIVLPALLAVGVCCSALALNRTDADTAPAVRETLALQEAMQSAIQEAEPAVVCVLISRNGDYIKLGQTPPPDGSGKLGGFDARAARARSPEPEDSQPDEVKKLDLKDPDNVPEAYGSGIVIDESGLVLTAEHLVRNATKIYVRLPGGKGSYADVHAADPRSDLAVLRLVDPVGKLKAIKLGDGGKLRKGQWVISLANPWAAGFRDGSPSASWGIVSNLRRRPAGPVNELERIRPLHQHGILLQTDIRLNVGCSGGAILDLKGELVGVSTPLPAVTTTDTPGGFAIPVDTGIKRIIEVLKRGEEVEYGFLGVQLMTNPEANRGLNGGILINGTVDASPAAAKGLQARDVIVSVNGIPINDNDDLFVHVSAVLAGNEAKLEVLRNGLPRTVTVTLDKFNVYGKPIASRRPPPVRGLRVDYLSVLMQALDGKARPTAVSHGVIVREAADGSPAARVLKVNDVITHVKGQPVATPADFYKKIQGLTGPIELTLSNNEKFTLN